MCQRSSLRKRTVKLRNLRMTKVKIKNFQSIKEVDFEVDGFTVIVGKNNIGKSAVVRAIDSALINQVGKEFIRRGETSAEVYLDYEGQKKTSGLKLEWKKSGSSSSYTVNGKVFTKLGRAVPPPIIEAGFDHMSIGDTKISPLVAHQFEPLFLLDKPGSVVTEVLSSLYDLNVFSQADDACQKDLKIQKSLLKIREADFKIREEKLEVFKDFESIQSEVKISGEISVECDALSNELEILKEYEEALNKSSRLVTVLTPIKNTEIPDSTDCESLSNVLETLKKYEEALNRSDLLQL
jgi:predicted ATPase